MDPINYAALDPGIRNVVRWLNEHGYKTTDSGDGKSKFDEAGHADEGVLDYPHVVILIPNVGFLAEMATRLYAELFVEGVRVVQQGDQGVTILASYDPAVAYVGVIMLCGLDDGLFASYRALRKKHEADLAKHKRTNGKTRLTERAKHNKTLRAKSRRP